MSLKRLIFSTIYVFLLFTLPLLPVAKDCEKAKIYFKKAYALDNTISNLVKKEQLYKRAVTLCPSYVEAHNNLGDVYEKQRRFEEAISQYKKAIELQSTAPWPYFGIGDIYWRNGRYHEAGKWYKKGLMHKPNDPLTLKRMRFINDIQKGGIIRSRTIRGMLKTRGVGEEVSISFGEGLIPFDFDKANIRPDARPQLDEIGKALRAKFAHTKDISIEKREAKIVEIAGHTDARGTDEYNIRLSKKRSDSVISYLVKNFNVPKEKLIAVGYGERVPLCTTDASEACHALNRRVEIILKPARGQENLRSASHPGSNEPEIVIDTGFFFKRKGGKMVEVLKEETRLRSGSDQYFFFFRPLQDCYVYLLQEDSSGNVDLIFPWKDKNAYIKKGRDCWVPGFGRGFTLDKTQGEEKICLLATSWPIEADIEGISLKEQVKRAVGALKTRAIMVVRPKGKPEKVSSEELDKKPQKIEELIQRIEGKGGWVKVVRFWHE